MSGTRRWLLYLILLLALALVGVPGVAQGQAVKNPDTLIYAHAGDHDSLDPAWQYDTLSSGTTLWNVYETLIFFRGISVGDYVPLLAKQVPSLQNGLISADARTFIFPIDERARFSDGTPVTAEDVKYSLMRFMLMDRDGGPSWILLSTIIGEDTTRDKDGNLKPDIYDKVNRAIQVRGNNVVITLHRPYAPFLNIMASWSMVISKRAAIAKGDWDGTKATVAQLNNPKTNSDTKLFDGAIGSGPFVIERWDRQNKTVVLVRNDRYWRGTPPALRRVIFRTVEEFATRRLMLQQGDADVIDVGRAEQSQVEGLAGVRIVDDLATFVTQALFMNLKISAEGNPYIGSGKLDGNGIPPDFFSDVHVRRAIAYSFDYATFARDAYRGKITLGNGPIPRGMFGYNPRGQWYTTNRDRAIAEWREAWGGRVWDQGFKMTVLFNSGNTARRIASQILKSNLEALNPKFKVETQGLAWSTYLAQENEGKLPIYFLGWAADYADPDNFVYPFMHSNGTFTGAQSYKNPEVDRLIEEAQRTANPERRRQIYFRLQEIAYSDVPTIYLGYPTGFTVMRTWVRGWYWNPIFFVPTGYLYTLSKGQ
ncbi:MAG: ABC transporter substrate-binding protein [Armatimonadota bacterium]|nr:ABC transporter substrate-binding protein [Armatimonadota bacterium]MDR7404701.1 ABC transporter substrate-binding protein [Armatimonadota bacterium]